MTLQQPWLAGCVDLSSYALLQTNEVQFTTLVYETEQIEMVDMTWYNKFLFIFSSISQAICYKN